MRRRLRIALFALATATLLWSAPVRAVQPDEVLSDPALEQRARDLSAELRCMVCQNQSIDDSDAELARDLRILVRDRLEAGDSNEQVLDYIVARYGEFVLLKPRLNVKTVLLWSAPLLFLLIGGSVLLANARQRRKSAQPTLSKDEEARLDRILNDRD
ncbi:cytochrome c-type biogenesis protein [Nitratireductor sp. ZSWI3]|uniref:cytochrome c-type biogenesis protein n=1 Tax=Nitratireductor sp. ZSWI3 TaxID=2966359 RepID=UPI00214F7F37|nr:cytochrome c-type biogenesis protein [Nitratireductor sp. ZSWI3]MCR4268381.1 cytochrome c-type biogenesis protein CcmH [Nitratireductor sp. ZSWI3]